MMHIYLHGLPLCVLAQWSSERPPLLTPSLRPVPLYLQPVSPSLQLVMCDPNWPLGSAFLAVYLKRSDMNPETGAALGWPSSALCEAQWETSSAEVGKGLQQPEAGVSGRAGPSELGFRSHSHLLTHQAVVFAVQFADCFTYQPRWSTFL